LFKAYAAVLKKYADFSGRARRSEYWYFVLINVIIGVILFALMMPRIIEGNVFNVFYIIFIIYDLAIFIPNLAVMVRRLHDIGKSGAWIFISFVPIIGGIWFIVLLASGSDPDPNDYGPNLIDDEEEDAEFY